MLRLYRALFPPEWAKTVTNESMSPSFSKMSPKVPILSILVSFLASAAHAKDMQEYLSTTHDLVRQGEHEEALERFIWFHNHALEHDRAMYGVRLSFALGYWKQLGDAHPPALEAMEEIRDEKTKLLKDGGGDFALFHDVLALNRTLGENRKTIQLFEQIDEEQPERAKEFWRVAKDLVLDQKRYDLARKHLKDPVQAFNEAKADYERNLALYDNPQVGGERFAAYNEKSLVEESLRLIKLALAFENEAAAKEIQQKALDLVDDDRLRDAF